MTTEAIVDTESSSRSNCWVIIGDQTIRYDQFVLQLFKADVRNMMLLHATVGVAGEVLELRQGLNSILDSAEKLIDALKRYTIYEKKDYLKNVVEELGDMRFYMQAIQNILQITDSQVTQANADKLSTRYKSLTYSNEAAIARADKVEGKDDASSST